MSWLGQHVVGVDIGNSGMRLATLYLDRDDDQVSRRIGSVERIDWKPRDQTHPSLTPQRFFPDDPSWLSELERQLARISEQIPDFSSMRWVISSVRRDASEILKSFLADEKRGEWHFVSRNDIDMSMDVEFPDRVGIDRVLAAYAATHQCEHRPLIVIQAGSAITVDWVNAAGQFAGGAIVPGVPMMLRLLGQAADLLPHIEGRELVELPSIPGRNTEQAMMCGVSSAVVGGTQHLVARYRSQSSTTVPVILSGGDGPRLAKHLASPVEVVDHLVLVGLSLVAKQLLAR